MVSGWETRVGEGSSPLRVREGRARVRVEVMYYLGRGRGVSLRFWMWLVGGDGVGGTNGEGVLGTVW